jgi:putative MATE family efflux protein
MAFALPMLAGNLLQTAYSFINAFWVGKFLGTAALAAVTVSMPVVFLTFALAGGLTLATNVLVAQYFGARDYPRVRRTVQTSGALIGVVSLLLLGMGLLFSAGVLRAINTPADILARAEGYLRIMLWSIPLSFGVFLIGSMLRGIGDSQTPVYFQAASVVLNAALDPLLMFGWLGFPRLGLNGTACATLIAQVFAVVGLLLWVPRKRPLVAPDWRHLGVEWPTGLLLLRIGLPAMVQQSVVSVSMVVITSLVSGFGTVADAAFGAALRIDQIAFLPALTVGAATSTLAGQNIGARQFARVRWVYWWAMLLSGGISLVITGLAVGLPRIWLRAFLSDAEAISIGVGYLRIVGFTYVLYAAMFVSHGVINGAGHTTATTLISVITLWGVRLPLAAVLSEHLHAESGIWLGMLVSVGASMLLSQGYYFSGRWRKPVVRKNDR